MTKRASRDNGCRGRVRTEAEKVRIAAGMKRAYVEGRHPKCNAKPRVKRLDMTPIADRAPAQMVVRALQSGQALRLRKSADADVLLTLPRDHLEAAIFGGDS